MPSNKDPKDILSGAGQAGEGSVTSQSFGVDVQTRGPADEDYFAEMVVDDMVVRVVEVTQALDTDELSATNISADGAAFNTVSATDVTADDATFTTSMDAPTIGVSTVRQYDGTANTTPIVVEAGLTLQDGSTWRPFQAGETLIEGEMEVSGETTLNDILTVNADLRGDNSKFEGTLEVDGAGTFNSDVGIAGDLTVNTNAEVEGYISADVLRSRDATAGNFVSALGSTGDDNATFITNRIWTGEVDASETGDDLTLKGENLLLHADDGQGDGLVTVGGQGTSGDFLAEGDILSEGEMASANDVKARDGESDEVSLIETGALADRSMQRFDSMIEADEVAEVGEKVAISQSFPQYDDLETPAVNDSLAENVQDSTFDGSWLHVITESNNAYAIDQDFNIIHEYETSLSFGSLGGIETNAGYVVLFDGSQSTSLDVFERAVSLEDTSPVTRTWYIDPLGLGDGKLIKDVWLDHQDMYLTYFDVSEAEPRLMKINLDQTGEVVAGDVEFDVQIGAIEEEDTPGEEPQYIAGQTTEDPDDPILHLMWEEVRYKVSGQDGSLLETGDLEYTVTDLDADDEFVYVSYNTSLRALVHDPVSFDILTQFEGQEIYITYDHRNIYAITTGEPDIPVSIVSKRTLQRRRIAGEGFNVELDAALDGTSVLNIHTDGRLLWVVSDIDAQTATLQAHIALQNDASIYQKFPPSSVNQAPFFWRMKPVTGVEHRNVDPQESLNTLNPLNPVAMGSFVAEGSGSGSTFNAIEEDNVFDLTFAGTTSGGSAAQWDFNGRIEGVVVSVNVTAPSEPIVSDYSFVITQNSVIIVSFYAMDGTDFDIVDGLRVDIVMFNPSGLLAP